MLRKYKLNIWSMRKKCASFCMTSSSGFTFIELIVVIMVMGILTQTVVLNVGNTVEETRVKNAVHLALADVRTAQELAMNSHRTVRFVVQSGSDRYYAIYTDDGSAVINGEGEPIDRTFNTGDFKGVSITGSETNSNLTFSDIGRPDIGSGYFTDAAVMELNGGDYTITVLGSGLTTFQNVNSSSGCGC